MGRKRKEKLWPSFLKIRSDGWSSKYQSVDALLNHLGRKSRSVSSRNNYCYTLCRMCLKFKLDPDELIALARENPDAVVKLVQEFADGFNSRGSVKYANHIIYLARTIFEVNGVHLKLHGFYQPTRRRKRPEHVPSLPEALKMADAAGNLRDRVINLLMAYSGLRNSDVRALVYNEDFPDPLFQDYTIKKQLSRDEECLVIVVHEVMKTRVPTACKNRIFYYTFIPPNVTEWLRLYLRDMEEKYGPIQDDQPLFPTQNRHVPLPKRLKTPLSARELQEIVKKAARRAGLEHWKRVTPHCLRKTFDSLLRNQPDDVKLDIKEREFLMGHILGGSQDAYFDKMKIEEMREKYVKMNFDPIAKPKIEQRLVSEDELQTFLEQGWQVVTVLPSGKVVVSGQTGTKETRENSNVEKNHRIVTKEENVHIDTRTPMREPSSLNSYLNSSSQKTRHLCNETLKERRGQLSIQNWAKPQACKSLSNLEPIAKTDVEEKEHVAESTSRNKVAETRQRRLSDFVA